MMASTSGEKSVSEDGSDCNGVNTEDSEVENDEVSLDSDSNLTEKEKGKGHTKPKQRLESEITSFPAVEHIVENMVCHKCQMIADLSLDFHFCENFHFLCDPCVKNGGSGTECPVSEDGSPLCLTADKTRSQLTTGGFPLYSAIFKAAQFECKYKILGCKEIVAGDELRLHHEECPFRPTEACIFTDCANFLSSRSKSHYIGLHKLNTFSATPKTLAILYDRPEQGASSDKKKIIRWVSCIFEIFNHRFFLTVEKDQMNLCMWMYDLKDGIDLEKFKVRIHVRNKQAREMMPVGFINVHSRSKTPTEIRNLDQFLKLNIDEDVEPNLYSYGRGNETDLRYLIVSISISDKLIDAEKETSVDSALIKEAATSSLICEAKELENSKIGDETEPTDKINIPVENVEIPLEKPGNEEAIAKGLKDDGAPNTETGSASDEQTGGQVVELSLSASPPEPDSNISENHQRAEPAIMNANDQAHPQQLTDTPPVDPTQTSQEPDAVSGSTLPVPSNSGEAEEEDKLEGVSGEGIHVEEGVVKDEVIQDDDRNSSSGDDVFEDARSDDANSPCCSGDKNSRTSCEIA